MKINKLELPYFYKDGFCSKSCDGMRHIKTLPYLSVVQAVEGNYDIKLADGKTYNTGVGGFFIAPSNTQQTIVHNADNISKNMFCRWVFLKIKVNDLYDFDYLFDFPVILPENYKFEMNLLFDRLFNSNNIFDEYVCCYEIIRILSLITQEKAHKASPYLGKALAYITKNFHNKINVREIANEVMLSESHLFSVFKKGTGVSPITYLNNYRLSVAADLLLKTDKTVAEISHAVGIDDSVYFNKLFRKAYQMPPTKYRETYYQKGRKMKFL